MENLRETLVKEREREQTGTLEAHKKMWCKTGVTWCTFFCMISCIPACTLSCFYTRARPQTPRCIERGYTQHVYDFHVCYIIPCHERYSVSLLPCKHQSVYREWSRSDYHYRMFHSLRQFPWLHQIYHFNDIVCTCISFDISVWQPESFVIVMSSCNIPYTYSKSNSVPRYTSKLIQHTADTEKEIVRRLAKSACDNAVASYKKYLPGNKLPLRIRRGSWLQAFMPLR